MTARARMFWHGCGTKLLDLFFPKPSSDPGCQAVALPAWGVMSIDVHWRPSLVIAIVTR
jgi:hypothetical protein